MTDSMETGVVLVEPPTTDEANLWTLQAALERIVASKHGDASWMRSVARKALVEVKERDAEVEHNGA